MRILCFVSALLLVLCIGLGWQNWCLHRKLQQLTPGVNAKSGFFYLAIGNSITRHPKCSYWWNEQCGMAASAPERDYVHLVAAHLSKIRQNVQTEVMQFYQWEGQAYDRAESLLLLRPVLDKRPDLITVQLGENVRDMETLEADYVELLICLKKQAPQARILVLDDYWSPERSQIRRRAARQTGCAFVDLSSIINQAEYQCGIGSTVVGDDQQTHVVEQPGVAIHPGDKGMQFIADAIIQELEHENSSNTSKQGKKE